MDELYGYCGACHMFDEQVTAELATRLREYVNLVEPVDGGEVEMDNGDVYIYCSDCGYWYWKHMGHSCAG